MTKSVAIAFSGGLDTSWLVAKYAEEGFEVWAITVDTGGWTPAGREALHAHAKVLGARHHILIDGRDALYQDHISWLIKGNVLRGGVYPLCVGVERVVQAKLFALAAKEAGVRLFVHGSTGAGNDQVRFDVTLRAIAPDADVVAPIRDGDVSREASMAWLEARGLGPMQKDGDMSINRGLWGTTAGGKETHHSWEEPSESAYTTTCAPETAPPAGAMLTISFHEGLPVAVDGLPVSGWSAIEALADIGSKHGVGRGIHVGDTILGIKGRIAFEAPAASILLTAHRELEKLVLTAGQRFWKDHMANVYGDLVHEAKFLDPLARDIEAMLASSQVRVTGEVRVKIRQGLVQVVGARSPFSMMDIQETTYGEHTALWTGDEAKGFSKIHGTTQWLSAVAGNA
jgi:argininosuccinate synthase